MKIERVNSQVFKLDGASYPTGDYIINQNETRGTLDLYMKNGGFSLPLFKGTRYSDLANAAGVKYSTFAAASAALAAAIAPGDGISSILSDKGTVTQATSKTTAVASSTSTTTITTVALSDAADASFTFNMTNAKALTTSAVLVSVNMNGGTGKALVDWRITADGTVILNVTNVGTAAFNSAIKIVVTIL